MRPKSTPFISSFFLLLPQEGRTALIRASQNGHASVVEKLLVADADHGHQDKVRNLVTSVMVIQMTNDC